MTSTAVAASCNATRSTHFAFVTDAYGQFKPHLSIWPTGKGGLRPLRDVITASRADQLVLCLAGTKDIHRKNTLVRTVRPFELVVVCSARLDVHGLSIEARNTAERPRGSREAVALVECDREVVDSAVT